MTKKRRGGRRRSADERMLPEALEELLRPMAREAAREHMTLGQVVSSSPMSELLGRFVELMLEAEQEHHLGYGWGERENEALRFNNRRNGYGSKVLKTQFGEVPISVPRDREGSFLPRVVPKHGQLSETIAGQILSLYTSGMSQRDIHCHIEELYNIEVDDGLVSRVVARVEPELIAWRNRPLEAVWPCVFVDALYVNTRHESGVERTAVYTAVGYNCEGIRQILGVWMAGEGQKSESASFWHQVLLDLKRRGVEDIFILCADGLTGMEQAVATNFPQTRFQRCVVHLIRNSMRYVPSKMRQEASADVRAIYQAVSFEAAKFALQQLQEKWSRKEPHLCDVWKNALPHLENLWTYGYALRRMVYTTNMVENLHRQIRKVTKTKSSFPNHDSALRLITLKLREIHNGYKLPRSDWAAIRAELELTFKDRVPNYIPWEDRVDS